MNTIVKLLIVIVVNGLMDWVLSVAFNFFNIGFEVYGNYVLWFNAITILAVILPRKNSSLFSEE